MKHFYNTNVAATTQRLAAKALGTAVRSKIFMVLLLGFFLLVSRESVGQGATTIYGPQTFDNTSSVIVQNISGRIEVVSGQLRAYTPTGSNSYNGYAIIAPNQFNLKRGYTYTVSFIARAVDHSQGGVGNVAILRGSSPSITWSSSSALLLGSTVIAKSNGFNNYSITFSADDNFNNQSLALGLSTSGGNQSELLIDNLTIIESCAPRNPQVTSNGSCSRPANITLSASGVTHQNEVYRWYQQAPNSTFTLLNSTGAQYTAENITQTTTYYVAIYNTVTQCESARVPVVARIGAPSKPVITLISGSCDGNGNEDKVYRASGAGMNEVYRWYNNDGTPVIVDGQALVGPTLTRRTNSQGGTYYVVIAGAGTGCESEREFVTVAQGYPTTPASASGSVCGNQLTLTATGAVLGESYRWYSTSGGVVTYLGQGATLTTTGNSTGVTYSVSKVNTASGCESNRLSVTTVVNNYKDSAQNPANGAIIEPVNPVVGQPATYRYSVSSSLDVRDVVGHTWYIYYANGTKSPAITTGAQNFLTISEMPNNLTGIELFLTLGPNACYTTANNGVITISNLRITPLPVELISFKAQRQAKGVNLTWATASELDNKGFEVQVSTDSKTFQGIAFVESKVGTTSIRQDYSFLDTKAVSGTRYYRLKQIDFDGTSSFSAVRAVSLGSGSGAVTAYPNPFEDVVIVALNGTEARNVRAVLTNAMGKVVLEQNEETAGNTITLNMASVTTKGMYMLHVMDNGTKHTFKLIRK